MFAADLVGACRLAGQNVAVADGQPHTYAELDEQSARAAGFLVSAGICPGDVVAVLAPRSWWRCVVILGIWRAGAVVCSVDPGFPAARALSILRSAQAQLTVRPPSAAALDGGEDQAELDLDSADQLAETRPGELVYVVATSGSTGEPKCVEMPSPVLRHLGAWHARHWPHPQAPATLHLSPVGFDVGYQELVAAWSAAAPLIVVDDVTRRDPFLLLRQIREQTPGRAFLSVAALQSLVIAASATGQPIPSLRQIFVSGEQLVINDEVRAAIGPATRVVNHYGPSETHLVTEYWLPEDPAAWPVHPPIGTAVPWAELMACENGKARHLRAGEEVELAVAGPAVARGYRGAPELTERKFVEVTHQDGTARRCYLTGDLVRFDGTVLHFAGRIDDQLKVRGYRVEPGDVEAVLNGIPGVTRAAVVGVRGRDSMQLAAAIVTAAGAPPPAARQLADICRAALPDYMVPIRFEFFDELPLSTNGKIARQAVADLISSTPPPGLT